MRSCCIAIALAVVMGFVLTHTVEAQDFAAPPPPLDLGTIARTMFQSPVLPSGQEAATAPPKSEPVPVPPAPPAQAVTIAPQQPAKVTLQPGQGFIIEELVEQPAPAPLKRTYRVTPAPIAQAVDAPTPVAPIPPSQPAAAPAPAPAQTVTGVLKPANALQRAIGGLGQKLVRVGYDRVLVPPAQPVRVSVQQPSTTYTVTPAPTPVAEQAVTATPQTTRPAKKGCFLFRR